jgi:hypothetical protein
MLDAELLSTREELIEQVAATERSIATEQSRQRLLRESTSSSQKTLNQLLDIQRLSLEQDAELPPEQQQAFVDSQQLFLDNQQKDQQLTETIVQLNERLNDLRDQQRVNEADLETQREPLREEYDRQLRAHRLRMATWKLSLLVPLLLITTVLLFVLRNAVYVPLIYALGAATLVKTFVVMNRYFPARYFKYVLVASSIAAVTSVLVYLLRNRAHPSRDALLKQYREAYETYFCPVCRYPIRRGPLRFAFWSRRSIRRIAVPTDTSNDPPYTCPACGTTLFEKCTDCGATRHTLLPACVGCGATRKIA